MCLVWAGELREREGRPREERNDRDFLVYIVPRKSAVIDKEQILEDITQEQDRLKYYDDEQIEDPRSQESLRQGQR